MALGTFVRERLVDMVARRTGLDPAEVRRRNFIAATDVPFTTASGLVIDSGNPTESLDQAREAAGYEALRKDQRRSSTTTYRGIGLCSYTEFTGMGSGTFRRRGMSQIAGHDAATVRVEPTGEVRGFVSAASQGQGHATTLAQVLADEIGVPMAAVSIVEGDTERCPYGSGSFARRRMGVRGGAPLPAARPGRAKVLALAPPHPATGRGGPLLAGGA